MKNLVLLAIVLVVLLAGCGTMQTWRLTWANGEIRDVTYSKCQVETYVTVGGGTLEGAAAIAGNAVFVECKTCDTWCGCRLELATQVMIAERLR